MILFYLVTAYFEESYFNVKSTCRPFKKHFRNSVVFVLEYFQLSEIQTVKLEKLVL